MSRPILPESAYEALGLDPETIKILMNPKPPDEPAAFAAPNLLQSDEDNARPIDPDETFISLYAELLLHVRTITLFASLRTHHSRETKAVLSSNGNSITVKHEGRAATLHMPFNVAGEGNAEMSLPSEPPNKNITLRLQLEELEDSDLLGALQSDERKVNIVPWDGASLDKQSNLEVWCKSCGGVVVSCDKITQWKDLPNENWAEMMDFWHCHKPDEHHLHDHTHKDAIGGKGYAAGNRLDATQGIGFVDLTSFLLNNQDCEGAHVMVQDNTHEGFVICKRCDATLGTPDEASSGWRLWKWNIDMHPKFSPQTKTHKYNTQKWITARLLYLIENTGLRKFHIHPTQPSPSPISNTTDGLPTPESKSTPSLLLWVFTPDLLFSSSIPSPDRQDPTRSMKVFYQQQKWQALQPGEPESASIEDVEFPEDLFFELKQVLDESQRVLPPTATKFQGWEVGLLQRFDARDIQDGAIEDKVDVGNDADVSSGNPSEADITDWLMYEKRNMRCSNLLSLPAELRLKIFEAVFEGFEIHAPNQSKERYRAQIVSENNKSIAFALLGGKNRKNYLSLLFVCRQIYVDAAHLPFKIGTFCFAWGEDFEKWVAQKLLAAQRNAIGTIRCPQNEVMFPVNFRIEKNKRYLMSFKDFPGLKRLVLRNAHCYIGILEEERIREELRSISGLEKLEVDFSRRP
ncbi:HECT-like ubiquitin-conjugating enzyme-binding-domain-containing protein [Phaeosphaeriaceae sp. PMI808]|nr:HECT-like ubiquitin-conjugating enzyme-binding-domain-containing protein [Phaeosphaeriaceae sp. PMI808]